MRRAEGAPRGFHHGLLGIALSAWLLASGAGRTQEQAPALGEIAAPADLGLLDPPVRDQFLELQSTLARLLFQDSTEPGILADGFGALAGWFFAYEYLEQAVAGYHEAAQLAPDDYRWRYYLGQVERRLGRTEEAIASLRHCDRLRPRQVAVLVWLARLERDAGRLQEALGWLERALVVEPESVAARFELGRLRLERSELEAALRDLETALAMQPEAPSIHYALGLAYRASGDLERARQHLESARVAERGRVEPRLDDPLMDRVRELETGSKAQSRRADWLFGEGRVREALVEYRRAHQARPDDPSMWANLGLAQLLAGQPREALQTLSALVARFPRFAGGRINLGVALSSTGDLHGAATQFLTALTIDPGAIEARDGLAALLVAADRHDEALDEYRKIVELDPANERARFRPAVLLLVIERYGDAALALRQAHEALPASVPLRLLLARVLAAAPVDSLRDGALARRLVEHLEGAPIEGAPIEGAPIEGAPIEGAPIEGAPIEGALIEGALSATPGEAVFGLETLAMVHAELGRFEAAAAAQRRALAIAEGLAGPAAERVRRRLETYLAERPCRRPYEVGELSL